MKLLKKVRIINWHYFYNVTFEVDQVNFLTGQNAAGKSTLIDAMQVVLLGDTSGRTFNKAANEKSGRTLKGYLKGEIGDDGLGSYKYLRTGRFSSYIVLEWFDDTENKSFCTGCVFDVYDDGSEEHHFFVINDAIFENGFVSNDIPMSYKQLQEYCSIYYKAGDYYFADSNAQYQNKLKDVFGGLKDKYFSLFKKAVSFTPITNIEQFLTEYVCDVPNEINIESMRNNIQQYKRLEIEAENMQVKINRLEEIHRHYEEYDKRKQELKLASYVSKRITYQVFLNSIQNLQKDISSSENRLNEIVKELASIDSQLESLHKQKEGLIAEKVSSGAYQLTNDLLQAKLKAEDKIKELEGKLKSIQQNFSSYILNYENSAKKILALSTSVKENRVYLQFKKDIDQLITTSEDMASKAEEFKKVLHGEEEISAKSLVQFKEAIESFKTNILDVSISLRGTLADMVARHAFARQQVLDMKNGSKMYDFALTKIKSELQHKLCDYFNEDVKVLIYADLVDIRNAKWTKAIEGFISSQKQNLFVEDKYYEVANRILPDIMRVNQYYRTGIVDTEKLRKANFIPEKNSLAEEIITDHTGARDYTFFLLGRILKCETFAEARECGHGITPKAEGYRNFASFVLPEKSYQYPLLGRKVSSEVMRVKEEEVKQNESLIQVLRTLNDSLAEVNKLDALNNYEVENAKEILDEAGALPGLKENLKRYSEELENTGSLEVSQIETKIRRIDEDIKALQDDKEQLISERGTLNQTIKVINEEKIPQQIEKSNIILNEIKENFDEMFINEIALPKFNEEMESGKSLADIRMTYDDLFTRSQNKIKQQLSLLNELRREYVLTYKLSYDITKDTNEDFERDLTSLRDVLLPQYQDKIKNAYEKATKEFKDDFIFKLKTSIETVRTQIDDLNEALKDAQFGQDSYLFTVTPAPQYREYYDMITDDLLLTYGNNSQEYFEKYEGVMTSLFKAIGDVSGTSDQNSVLEQNVAKFTDYRTYLMFDMMVKKGEGKSYSLAKNIKKQSGGETQTPFYVSILASFSQLYRIHQSGSLSNSIRLVIFDEAFSKMDSTRIIESIKILKNFGLQVILSAPSEKVADLSKLVDKTLLVSRQNNRSFVDSFEIKQDK